MRRTLLLSAAAVFSSAILFAQTPPARGTAKPTSKPTAKPLTLTVLVTDSTGAPLPDATVATSGPAVREGQTGPDGTVRLMNMRAGVYRVRAEKEGSITLERELTIRAGEQPSIEIALSSAPVAPEAPEPAPMAAVVDTTLPPPGEPRVTPVPLFLEKNFIGGREPRKQSPLGCGATGTATLHQLRDSLLEHTHDDADEWLYVVAGEGTLRIGTAEQRLQAGTFSAIPHTITHALIPQGRNPLIVISVISGPPCKQ